MEFIFILNILLLALGFGFVIFWHELGHFLAAKWAGVRVEQFAVGFGNAIVSFRQGLGIRFGTSAPEYETIKQTDPTRAETISPTEYRLNYIPLGGYVKMYGQEDMVASTTSTETDHYMNASVGKRMVIISAGVVMNVILAAVLFTIVFRIGFGAPSTVIGRVVPDSPADVAGVDVGDRILAINGEPQYAWTGVGLTTALLQPNETASLLVQPAGTTQASEQRILQVSPSAEAGEMGMVGIGVGPAPSLEAVPPKTVPESDERLRQMLPPDDFAVQPGERVVEVAGTPTDRGDYHVLWNAVQASNGQPVPIRVETTDGDVVSRQVTPRLTDVEGQSLLGLQPRVEVLAVSDQSESVGKILPGDVIERVVVEGTADTVESPSLRELQKIFTAAGVNGKKVDVTVQRDGEHVMLEDLAVVEVDPENQGYGLGFATTADSTSLQLGGIAPDSPADAAGVATGGEVVAVNGEPVADWFDVRQQLRTAAAEEADEVTLTVARGDEQTEATVPLSKESRAAILERPLHFSLTFIDNHSNAYETIRQTKDPFQAMWWGVQETKLQIVKLYVTLRRVIYDQTVPASNLTGPVGILHFGSILAQKGPDWLLWFLAMISANLAVVNFLPIPILDGGHMVFLASEKITGRPPSPKVQTAALYAGLVLIAGLVLFVTYNDIQRLPFF